jgi:hypothetical protein
MASGPIFGSPREIEWPRDALLRHFAVSFRPPHGPDHPRHWSVENNLHWVTDMIFRDDECRVRTDHATANLPTVKQMALNLIRRATERTPSAYAARSPPGMVTSSPAWLPSESFTRFPCRHPWRQSIAARALPPRRAQGRGPGRALVTRDHEALLVRGNESIYLSHGCVHRLDNPGRSHSPSSKYSPVAILARTTSCGSKARTDVDNPLPVALVAGINGREGASLLDSC